MTNLPHILIFNPDQMRADVQGHLGNPAAATPVLDSFAQTEAVSFRNAFCQHPICTPSRCAFMTGWYPHVRGHRTLHHVLQPDEPMLLRTLKQHGYYVWWGGKNHLIPRDADFDDYCDVYYYRDPYLQEDPMLCKNPANPDWRGDPDSDNYYSFYMGRFDKETDDLCRYDHDQAMVEGAIRLIQNPPTDQPLCIYLPLNFPHPTYGVEDPWFSQIDRAAVPPRIPTPDDWSQWPRMMAGIAARQGLQNWTEDRWRELRATYYGMCARIDYQFGLVMEALKQAGIYDDTAIFFFSDHGDYTGDYGIVEKNQNTFQDCLSNIPLLIKPPAGVPVQPRVSDALVELIDFPATVEALTGIKPDHSHFGRSLLPVLAGETDDHRNAVFCEGGRLPHETHCMESEVRQDEDFIYWPRLSLQRTDHVAHGKATMCRTQEYKYVRRLMERDELYDLRDDPQELHNRIDDPALQNVRAQMQDRLLTFYQETADVVIHRTDQLG